MTRQAKVNAGWLAVTLLLSAAVVFLASGSGVGVGVGVFLMAAGVRVLLDIGHLTTRTGSPYGRFLR